MATNHSSGMPGKYFLRWVPLGKTWQNPKPKLLKPRNLNPQPGKARQDGIYHREADLQLLGNGGKPLLRDAGEALPQVGLIFAGGLAAAGVAAAAAKPLAPGVCQACTP